MAQGSGPCRFGQYYKLHRIILDDLGLSHIPLYAPNQGPSLFDDLGSMGMKFLLSAWDGICAIDGLEARTHHIRPYEKKRGTTEQIYNGIFKGICTLIEKGNNILPLLKTAKEKFDVVELNSSVQKPKIGIVGEIYVRSQKFSNNFLVKRLEELGCEITLPSIAEWFFYTNFTRVRNCGWFRQYRRAVFTKLFDIYMKWRQNKIYKILELEKESDITTILDHANNYLHNSFEGEATVTIGKTVEFIKEDFSGVINVMPFTCMPGNIVTTIFKTLKEQYPDFPLFTMSLDGLDHAVDAMRLETFVSQAKSYLLHNHQALSTVMQQTRSTQYILDS
jgi:predicted nucleotide-binding protein (sugar kinase/HSP70/actin superfamily)